MVEEMEKMVTKEGVENSSSIINAGGEGSEAEEGEIVSGDLGDAEVAKALASPPPRHSLEHALTLWFDNPSAKQNQATWGSSIRPIYTYSSVEDFWSVYNNIHHPSKLAVGADFHCFKTKSNQNGKILFTPTGESGPRVFLGVIRHFLALHDEICGAVGNVRTKQEKIALWTKNAVNEATRLSIGRQWKEFLGYKDAIGFIFHNCM